MEKIADKELLDNFIGSKEINIVIPFIYEKGQNSYHSDAVETIESYDDGCEEVRAELDTISSSDFSMQELTYSNCLNTIFKVVEQIEKTKNKYGFAYSVTISGRRCIITSHNCSEMTTLANCYAPSKIEAVYRACVEFVKAFNAKNAENE